MNLCKILVEEWSKYLKKEKKEKIIRKDSCIIIMKKKKRKDSQKNKKEKGKRKKSQKKAKNYPISFNLLATNGWNTINYFKDVSSSLLLPCLLLFVIISLRLKRKRREKKKTRILPLVFQRCEWESHLYY